MINCLVYGLELISIMLLIHIVFQTPFCPNGAVGITMTASTILLWLAYILHIPFITYAAHLIMIWYCKTQFAKRWYETILRFACVVAIGAILETIMQGLFFSWFQTATSPVLICLVVNVFLFMTTLLLYYYVVNKQITIDLKDKTFFGLVLLINLFVLYVKDGTNGKIFRLVLYIVSFVLLIVRFTFLIRNQSGVEDEKIISKYMEQYEQLIQLVRRRQHDYKNEIQAIRAACLAGETSSIIEVIGEYTTSDQYTTILNGCENPIVAGLIFSKLEIFKKHGVIAECKALFLGNTMPISVREFTDIVGIVFDNAFECALTQKERVMNVEIIETESQIVVKTQNPSPYMSTREISNMFSYGYSTKGKNRGIGLNTVLQLVNGCNGSIIVGNKTVNHTNYFELQIVIPKSVKKQVRH